MNLNFQDIFEAELLEQVMALDEIEVPSKTIVLKEETYVKAVPIVLEGKIKVRKTDENGKEIILYHISPGESCILSITSCVNDKKSNFEALAEEDSKVVVVPAEKTREWMDKYKSWRKFVMQLYYARLDKLLSLVDSISFQQTDRRLIQKLRELQKQYGDHINITHQQLAFEIGTAREVISRLLKHLEKDGFLILGRGTIKIIKAL